MRNGEIRRKLLTALLIIIISAISFYIGMVIANPAVTTVLEEGSLTETASYVIFIDGSTVYAKNGRTGAIEFSGTDASTVINSAINALGTTGGKIFIKAGTYSLTTSLVLSADNLNIQGEGDASKIVPTANINVFTTPANTQRFRIRIQDLMIDGSSTTAGSAIYGVFKASTFTGLHIFRFNEYGIYLTGFGDDWSQVSYENQIIGNRIISNPTSGLAGIRIGYAQENPRSSDNEIHDNIIYYGRQGLLLYGSHNTVTRNHIVGTGAFYPNSYYSVYVTALQKLKHNYFDTPARQAVYIDSTVNVIGTVELESNTFLRASDGFIGEYSAITVNVSSTRIVGSLKINGNLFLTSEGVKAKYILETTGSGSIGYMNFQSNYINPLAWQTGVMNLGIVPTVLLRKGNTGYVTENSGTATMPDGQTTVVMNHGLVSTPKIVTVTPNKQTEFWVTDKTATQFTINIPSSITGGISFDWYAVV